MIHLAMLGVCTSLSMNLLTQFGLGMAIFTGGEDADPAGTPRFSPRLLLGFSVSLFLLWAVFTYVLRFLGAGPYWYLLLYPLGLALVRGLERLFTGLASGRYKFLPVIKIPGSFFSFPPAWVEFIPPALLISLHLALGPLEALVLALGFSLGLGFALGILREIHRRSRFEAVPPFLRGCPLALISLGLLSLVFTSASIMFFNLSRF
ncbi:MAG: hypothetical protein LBP20_06175 [Treponema sp.]|nr:hypothetical protein [Treponema sp.]